MKKLFTLFLLSISLVGFGQNCDTKYQNIIFDSVDVSTVQYGAAMNADGVMQDLFMDIYQPKGDTASNRPLVLLAFGGSFITGTRTSDELVYFANKLALRGYVVASIDYRLGKITDLGQEQGLVKTVFRAVQDGKAAVRFFRKDADTDNNYRINPATIFTGGTSAGAILQLHLAFVDDVNKLPMQWQTWLGEVGGLEGNSGNPGYCSKSNGVFSFSGGFADTSWIEPNDVPVYSVHSTQDGIVRYDYGRPIGGNAPIELYGSGLITPRLLNIGVHAVLDTYQDDTHPSFLVEGDAAETARRLDSTEKHLVKFLHDILPCNTNNVLATDQEQCQSFTSVEELAVNNEFYLYPNPADNEIFISNRLKGEAQIFDQTGKLVKSEIISTNKIYVGDLETGIYFVGLPNGDRHRVIIK
ncbi:alpha/beta hydrolase [Luteibaculum oceani]|nr:T9SS type A sorting domain-containing protein [Luteibaculum oceani]